MSRPIAVIASAVVAILGSIVTLVFALAGFASMFVETSQSRPPTSTASVLAGAAMFIALGIIGVWTSVGLFRLRPWARTSILVFSGFLAAGSLFGLLVTMTVPIPAEFSAATGQTFRRTMAAMFGIPMAIAVWWLIQFNTRSTKAAFASPVVETPSQRPLSISIIAWMSIVGGAYCLFPLLGDTPAYLFAVAFQGWAARIIYAVIAALSLYIGKGLLELREEARLLAIGWFVFTIVHMGLITLVPPLRQRMLEVQRELTQNQQPPIPFDLGTITNVMLVSAAIVGGVSIWFLIRNRDAFGRTENA